METNNKANIIVETTVQVPVDKAWEYFTAPQHVTKWNFANPEWHCPAAQSSLQPGGSFSYRMEARDESFGFDFSGSFDVVEPPHNLAYTMDDGRKARIVFEPRGKGTHLTEVFEAEDMNPLELQKSGWQAILDNYKRYVESQA